MFAGEWYFASGFADDETTTPKKDDPRSLELYRTLAQLPEPHGKSNDIASRRVLNPSCSAASSPEKVLPVANGFLFTLFGE